MSEQVKRGRPKNLTPETKRALQELITQGKKMHLSSLAYLQHDYLANEYSHKLRILISNVPVVASIPIDTARLPLIDILEGAAKVQMISELELIAASLLLSRLCESVFSYSTEELINTVYFVVKFYLESNQEVLKMIYEKLRSQFRNFPVMFREMRPFGNFSFNELNTHYNELYRQKGGSVNYMYYVDDILRLAPPYITKKAKKIFDSSKASDLVAENILKPDCTGEEQDDSCKKIQKIEEKKSDSKKEFREILPITKIDIRLKSEYQHFADALRERYLEETSTKKAECQDFIENDIDYFLDLS